MSSVGRASRRDVLVIAALVCAAGAFYLHFALRVGNFQDDEDEYLSVARYVAAHFPHALTEGALFPRGTQRLDPLLLAQVLGYSENPLIFTIAGLGSAFLPWLTGAVSASASSLRIGLLVPLAASLLMLALGLRLPHRSPAAAP